MSLLSPLMHKSQVLAELRISDVGLTKLRNNTKNPFPLPIKIGGKLYWRREELEAFLSGFLPKR